LAYFTHEQPKKSTEQSLGDAYHPIDAYGPGPTGSFRPLQTKVQRTRCHRHTLDMAFDLGSSAGWPSHAGSILKMVVFTGVYGEHMSSGHNYML